MINKQTKLCIGLCGEEKDISLFGNNKTYADGLNGSCRECKAKYNKVYREEHKEKIEAQKKEWAESHKEEINIYQKEYRKEHKEFLAEWQKEYYKENRKKLIEYQKEYKREHKKEIRAVVNRREKKRREIDIFFRLKQNVSRNISSYLRNNNSSKKGQSILKYLSYSFVELMTYLESQFEWWMTRENYGAYNPKIWNDNDLSTWKWSIDHIIPQSDLPYISMEDENFKKAWALSNLRPYSAKQNILDGANRVRHKK